ncbi:allophanate hydrolase [Rhizocola hellebori]|uniref:Allophanate hydrolase n=1 Tax=Rhizocola hellebori TaxID=1392758 RepID=A0A8J3VFZ9_9ACTN|nr:allophanate hydrolase [Rhizocola hellebori]
MLEVDDPAGWYRTLLAARATGELSCEEIVPAAETVLLAGITKLPELAKMGPLPGPESAAEVNIPVRWDGADLESVAERWQGDPPTVLRGLTLTVAFCGFTPGFAYLTGLEERYQLPRLDSPRPNVPAGSVAVAGPYAGIYPRSSPGGWQLLGHTEVTMFDPLRAEPALLTPGTRVRFTDA